ncbi:ABC transporter ATP-binding protein [Nocardioides lianchengensis]|uniref:Iron complex transport system ATP-binding protein n=1 Tax=Nocardioides lianchengensis TaxID=1045774 RepID=A0A1G7BJS6_9ACTN|nr:ABC transporter ATP-binding protein [Nocardioides lianchengensis]NYG08967.1 iron complex transport system ATP-binding protein [Nocardioides lianchengensis]SDE27371.1 iron complex transport system ATP-binding protein [Nocardioides lianchengensis]
MIEARGVSWSYGDQRVLDAVSLATAPGRLLGLIGPNGSGKTTLLRLLYGALSTPTGAVEVDGSPLTTIRPREAAQRLAVVVQESGGESTLTVAEMVLLGRTPHLSTFQRTGEDDHAIAADALRRVGATHLATRALAGLSGGERQRVLIARALTQQASHLLLDEPTNHLDIRYQHEVLGLLTRLVHELGTSSVVVLHDLNLASRYCDDLVLLGDGGIVAAGPTDQVLAPELLEPVYGIGVQRVEHGGELHLHFHPFPDTHDQEVAS